MKILAIETSCDETGVAVVEGHINGKVFTFTVLGNALLSQVALHREYGGVYPHLAKREHIKNLPLMLEQALKDSSIKNPAELDAIAVTQGPGLEPALWTGIEFSKQLSIDSKTPLLPVNHMEGHLISSLIEHSYISEAAKMKGELSEIKFPVLGLLISGGHTEFVLMRDWFQYEIIGETLDDAVGEAFDKVARMLGLPYPGGPEISKLAAESRKENSSGKWSVKLPRPMITSDNCDVSFSGLKTAALYALRDKGGIQKLTEDEIKQFAQEFEDTVGDVFTAKTLRALEKTNAQTFVLGGGVAANSYLREKLKAVVEKEFPDVDFKLPALSITGDNAIMIGEAALLHLLKGHWQLETKLDFNAVGSLSIAKEKAPLT
jgi:N6-L-threonylcarbamoyladenine synthase